MVYSKCIFISKCFLAEADDCKNRQQSVVMEWGVVFLFVFLLRFLKSYFKLCFACMHSLFFMRRSSFSPSNGGLNIYGLPCVVKNFKIWQHI